MRAVIFSGGTIDDYSYIKSLLKADDFIISADSGLDHLKRLGITPDVFIGDMDSVKCEVFGNEIIKLDAVKDETDTEASIMYAIEKGAEEIVLFGATGTRFDHTLANVMLLKKLYKFGVTASVIDSHNEIYYMSGKITIDGSKGDTLSIIPLSDFEGVTTLGLLYPLNKDSLEFGASRGVSNVMTCDTCTIISEKGEALVIKSRD